MNKGVILDRDGTLIDFYRDPDLGVVTPAFHPDHVRLLPGVVEGLELLSGAGFVLAIATNQPDAAKGALPIAAIERTNRALICALEGHGIAIAMLEVCLHHPEGGPGGDPTLVGPCDCRKPKGGLLERIIVELALDRALSWMVGDTTADAGAARAAGLRLGLLMQLERCELCQFRGATPVGVDADARGPSLLELARRIVAT